MRVCLQHLIRHTALLWPLPNAGDVKSDFQNHFQMWVLSRYTGNIIMITLSTLKSTTYWPGHNHMHLLTVMAVHSGTCA